MLGRLYAVKCADRNVPMSNLSTADYFYRFLEYFWPRIDKYKEQTVLVWAVDS